MALESMTAADLATKLGVSSEAAYGLLRFLTEKNLVTKVGERKKEGARGKGSALYDIPPRISADLSRLFTELFRS